MDLNYTNSLPLDLSYFSFLNLLYKLYHKEYPLLKGQTVASHLEERLDVSPLPSSL